MLLTDCWQVAAYGTEIGRALLKRTIVDVSVILYRIATGDTVAMANRCPHRYVPLSLGHLDGDVVQCGHHGLRFAPSGACVGIPGQPVIPRSISVQVFPTIERHGFVWIWMGNAVLADQRLIPNFYWFDDPAWATAEGHHHVAADYRFLVDNLLDLSHETFVHPETIGNGAVAESPVKVTTNADAVRAHRDIRSCEPPPQFVALAGFTGPIDRWHTTLYTPPGFCVIEVGAVPAGTGDLARGFEVRILNLITPETATSSHYFWAHARQIRRKDVALTDAIRRSVIETFDQNKVVLEAQQIEAGLAGSVDPGMVLGIDAGPVRGRRILAKALADEQLAREVTIVFEARA